jgi:spore coat protein A, manganese oxidase
MNPEKKNELTRRDFVKTAAIAGTVFAAYRLPIRSAQAAVSMPPPTAAYNSPNLTLFLDDLRGVTGPEGIPVAASDGFRYWRLGQVQRFKPLIGNYTAATHYTINVNQYQDVLHPELDSAGGTYLWGYHPSKVLVGSPTQRHLGGIIVAKRGQPIQITFRNNLPPAHILPVDTSLPGADQAQNRTAVHIHGGLVPWISDGGPHDWWTPDGMHGDSFLNNDVLNPRTLLNPGAARNEADYYYPMDQSARLVWYHDHAYGITRLNAYAGVATALIIRDDFEAYLKTLGLPDFIEAGGNEIPLVIQDKVFFNSGAPDDSYNFYGGKATHGALWYPYAYDSPEPGGQPLPTPSCVPEMFGDTMLVNGKVFPKVKLEARRYRFRILNACQARYLNLQLLEADATKDGVTIVNGVPTNDAGPDFLVIGTEGGFLPKPALVPSKVPFSASSLLDIAGNPIFPGNPPASLLTGLAERWDVILDFAGKEGRKFILYNDAPGPFPGGGADTDYYFGNPDNILTTDEAKGPSTRVLMRFDIGPAVVDEDHPADGQLLINENMNFSDEAQLHGLTWNEPLLVSQGGELKMPEGVPVRYLTLNETADQFGRLIQMIGTNTPDLAGNYGLEYTADPTEIVGLGQTEIWEIANLTADVHPIHFHLVNVQILNRQFFDSYAGGKPAFTQSPILPSPIEVGWKETVNMYPQTVTRVIMKFDLPKVPFQIPESPRTGGHEYVWHCHILEHEEHDMMRPLIVMEKLYVTPSEAVILSLIGGKKTFRVNNSIGNLLVSAPNLPASCQLKVDQLNKAITVTVPRNAKMPKPGVKVIITVTDTSGRPADQCTDTATLTITNVL